MKQTLIRWLLSLLGHNLKDAKTISITYQVDDTALKDTLRTLERMESLSRRIGVTVKKGDYRTIDELIRIVENVVDGGFKLSYNKCTGWEVQAGDVFECAPTQRQVLEELILRLTNGGKERAKKSAS